MQIRHTSLMAFYTALLCTAFALAAAMSDTWFIDGHDMKADNGHTHLSIGLPKSTWNMDCGNAVTGMTVTSAVTSATSSVLTLFVVTSIVGALTSVFSLLCGLSIQMKRSRTIAIALSALFFILFVVAFGKACALKNTWGEFLHVNGCHGQTAVGGAWLATMLGAMTAPIIPIFIASDAHVDSDYEKVPAGPAATAPPQKY